jgi:hypothetical protein
MYVYARWVQIQRPWSSLKAAKATTKLVVGRLVQLVTTNFGSGRVGAVLLAVNLSEFFLSEKKNAVMDGRRHFCFFLCVPLCGEDLVQIHYPPLQQHSAKRREELLLLSLLCIIGIQIRRLQQSAVLFGFILLHGGQRELLSFQRISIASHCVASQKLLLLR